MHNYDRKHDKAFYRMVMMDNVAVRTIVPILLLIGTGLLSRRMRISKAGDERVFSAYVYYFALPSLFFINMTEANFTSETLIFTIAGVSPLFVMLMIYSFLYLIFRFSRNIFYLLTVSTVFGSLAFFGIPFITFAFPADGERLATLAAAFIAIVGVTTSLIILELYELEKSTKIEGIKKIAKRLSRNPLMISILSGLFLSLVGIEIPAPISDSLHMLGSTISIVAMFMLGVSIRATVYEDS